MAFRKKIDTLSRVNHKNFVNLIGYCEEDEPFTRMMVFEYAPNGTLYEHLHEITDISFCSDLIAKSKYLRDDLGNSELPALADPETNIYSFGILLLEIISGKSLFSEEQGSLLNWAEQYLKDKMNMKSLVDPTLKSFKNNELTVICMVIEECL